MPGDELDVRAARASGPEVRRTTGGMPYRVSRTHTPDLVEIRRELDRKHAAAAAAANGGAAHSTAALDGFAWIKRGLRVSISGNKVLAPSNSASSATAHAKAGGASGRGVGASHAGAAARQSSSRRPEGSQGDWQERPQTARQLTSRPPGDAGGRREGAAFLTPRRPQTARPATRASPNLSTRLEANSMGQQDHSAPSLAIEVPVDEPVTDEHAQMQDLGGYMGQKSVLRRRRAGEAPPPPQMSSPELLRDAMATLEGRWAGGIQKRIEIASAAAYNPALAALKQKRNNQEYPLADKPIIAAASHGAILPFSTHPVVTDPLHSVWKHKKAGLNLDPHKTSAGLTQDLINWSKFDNRYGKHPPGVETDSSTTGVGDEDVLAQEAAAAAEEDKVRRRNQDEWASAMQRVQRDLQKERKSDTARFHAMVREGWTMAHRQYEDALHLDLRRGLSNAKVRLDEVTLERDQFKVTAELMEGRCKVLKDKCDSLEELLQLKQNEMMQLDRETAKLRFLIGMREGELAQQQRQLDHAQNLKGSLENRQLFDQAPGGEARSVTPVMNEIDGSASSLIKDLTELENDLNRRIGMTEKMGSMVETVAVHTKKRVEYEASLRPVFVEAEAQTACELADMEMLCVLDEEVDENEDSWLWMQKLRAAHRGKQRSQVGVPESFKDVILDSRRWNREKENRTAAVLDNPTEILCRLISLFFSKMHSRENEAVLVANWPHTSAGDSLPHHIHEVHLQAWGDQSEADLETMDLVAVLEHEGMRSNELVRIFARLCGIPLSSTETPLPLETLNFLLDTLFILHEMSREQHKRVKMSAKERSQKKGPSDEELMAKKFEAIPDDKNTLIAAMQSGEVVSFKMAQVCKVLKEVLASRAQYPFNAGEELNFQEANKLLHLEDSLEYAIRVYEDVRAKRLVALKETFRSLCPSGKLSYGQLEEHLLAIEPTLAIFEIRRIYRDMAVRSGGSDKISADAFCQVLQEQRFDRPADISLVQKGADPFQYAGFSKDGPAGAATRGGKKGKKGHDVAGTAPSGAVGELFEGIQTEIGEWRSKRFGCRNE